MGNLAYFKPIRGKARYDGYQTNSYFEIVEIVTFSELGCNITVNSEKGFNFLFQKLLPHRLHLGAMMHLEEQHCQEMTNYENWFVSEWEVMIHAVRPQVAKRGGRGPKQHIWQLE